MRNKKDHIIVVLGVLCLSLVAYIVLNSYAKQTAKSELATDSPLLTTPIAQTTSQATAAPSYLPSGSLNTKKLLFNTLQAGRAYYLLLSQYFQMLIKFR